MKLFKRILSLLLCPAMLTLCACTGPGNSGAAETSTTPEETIDPNAPLCDGKTLKVLAITSSFGSNTTQLLYDIAKAQGCTDVVVARLYGSGCTLKKHVENTKTNEAYYQYTKRSNGKWETTDAATMLYGLQDEDWDIIFTQQSAARAGDLTSYENYIDQLMEYVQANKTNPNARFVWNMTWAYQGDSQQDIFVNMFNSDQMYMYNQILEATKINVVPRTDFAAIIPSGTAIQNARTSFIGDTLTKDTYHLNALGRAIAGYTMYATLTGEPLTQINLTEITKEMVGDTQPLTLTDADKQVIIEAVNAAIATPFAVTPSTYTQP